MMNSSRWKIVQIAIALTGLGWSLPAQANDLGSAAGSIPDWQRLCQQYLPDLMCESDSLAEPAPAYQGSDLVAQTLNLSGKLPTLPAGTPESAVNCFMRNSDGSILDLTRLCNATSSHPLFAQISVTRDLAQPPARDLLSSDE